MLNYDKEITNKVKDSIKEIQEIAEELAEIQQRNKGIGKWTIAVWIFSAIIALTGLVLAPSSGGLSLILDTLAIIIFLSDVANTLRKTAKEEKDRERADFLYFRLSKIQEKLSKLSSINDSESKEN